MIHRRVFAVALAATIAAGAILVARLARESAGEPFPGSPYVSSLPDPGSHLGRFFTRGDGQFYAALAIDPSLSKPEAFSSRGEAAYRGQRPLLSWLAWVAGLGRPRAVETALVVLFTLSVGFAAGACALLSVRRSGSSALGAAVLVIPGSIAVLGGLGSELLALGFAAAALVAWMDRRVWLCSVLLMLAAFSRETLLLVPAAIAATDLIRYRPRAIRHIAPLALPFVTWGAWLVWIRLRVGVWPGSHGRVAAPFVGLVRAIPDWQNTALNAAVIGLAVAMVVALAVHRRRDLLGIVALAHVPLAVVAGEDVWHAWENFSRPLLPLFAFGLIALLSTPDGRLPPPAISGAVT